MFELFAGGRVIDLILGGVAIEAFAVVSWRLASGHGPTPTPFLANLLSGAFLLIALRNALAVAPWPWIACCLLAALAAHLVDLAGRWEGKKRKRRDRPTKLPKK
jgi:hypothetical protein